MHFPTAAPAEGKASGRVVRGKGTKRSRSAELDAETAEDAEQPARKSRTAWIPVTDAPANAGGKSSGRASKPSSKASSAPGKKGKAAAASELTAMEDEEDGLDDDKLTKRERNKVSASKYRKRRKLYLDSLEGKVAGLLTQVEDQAQTITSISTENAVRLRLLCS